MDDRPGRVLYVSFAPPVPTRLGPARRHYHLLDQLTRFYDVELLSLGTAWEQDAVAAHFGTRVTRFEFAPKRRAMFGRTWSKTWRTLTGRCDFLPPFEPELQARCRQLTSSRGYDAILLSSALLRPLLLPRGVPVVADTHNVEFDVLRQTASRADWFLMRQYARLQWRAMRRQERWCGHHVDLLLATSDRDRHVFEQELGIADVAVIPNGIDLREFDGSNAPTPGTIIFSGLMSYYPNEQAIRWFLDAIFPRIRRQFADVRLVVAGASPPRWLRARASDRIEVTGWVKDIRPYLERASVVIVPLLIGGGTRVKILEAQAMRRPVVSTTLGAEGLGLRHGESIMLADDAESFAARVVELLTDAELAARIAARGRSHVVRHFDWEQIGETVSRLLKVRLGLNVRSEPLGSHGRCSRAARIA